MGKIILPAAAIGDDSGALGFIIYSNAMPRFPKGDRKDWGLLDRLRWKACDCDGDEGYTSTWLYRKVQQARFWRGKWYGCRFGWHRSWNDTVNVDGSVTHGECRCHKVIAAREPSPRSEHERLKWERMNGESRRMAREIEEQGWETGKPPEGLL